MKLLICVLAVIAAPFVLLKLLGFYTKTKTGRGSKPWPWLCLPLAATLILTGCRSAGPVQRTWYKPWTWRADQSAAERKATDAKKAAADALDTNSVAIVRAAAGKVAATGAALAARTNREPATDLAATFNQQAAALLPQPTVAELNELKAIVGGLLSTNAAERASATERLAVKDKELAELQRMTGELRAKLDAAEQSHAAAVAKLKDAYADERRVADQWRQHQAKTWFARIADLLGTGGMVALAVLVPAAAPLAGRLFGFMSKVMPSSAVLTGVVSKASFENVVAGTEMAVSAVRQRDPALASQVLDALRIGKAPDDDRLIDRSREVVAKNRSDVRRAKEAALIATGKTA